MVTTIYVESEIEFHPRTEEIVGRFPKAEKILCDRYTEVFNPKSQNFRLQKTNPALILAKKHKGYVLPTPPDYGVGGDENYYFSHMLNCVYDCRYCFLQGMYSSANYVVFVNYEDFTNQILSQSESSDVNKWFFSGYDCDSLAFEPITGFIDHCLDVFERIPQSSLEIRTKSTQIRSLLSRQALSNVVVAFSFTPDDFSKRFEHGVPNVSKRISAMKLLEQKGWKLGLRFDPMLSYVDYQNSYAVLFESIFEQLEVNSIHSVSMGGFRMPKDFFKKVKKLYPQEPLYNLSMKNINGMKCLPESAELQMLEFCRKQILNWVPESKLFYCSI